MIYSMGQMSVAKTALNTYNLFRDWLIICSHNQSINQALNADSAFYVEMSFALAVSCCPYSAAGLLGSDIL